MPHGECCAAARGSGGGAGGWPVGGGGPPLLAEPLESVEEDVQRELEGVQARTRRRREQSGRRTGHRPGRRSRERRRGVRSCGWRCQDRNMSKAWMIDEVAHAGPEHLDAAFVAGYDRKQGYPDPAEDLAALREHGIGTADRKSTRLNSSHV